MILRSLLLNSVACGRLSFWRKGAKNCDEMAREKNSIVERRVNSPAAFSFCDSPHALDSLCSPIFPFFTSRPIKEPGSKLQSQTNVVGKVLQLSDSPILILKKESFLSVLNIPGPPLFNVGIWQNWLRAQTLTFCSQHWAMGRVQEGKNKR